MKVDQLSIFLENRAGRLAEVTRILAESGVNIRALSLADTSDFGILRLIVNDFEKAKENLKAGGFTVGRTTARMERVTGRSDDMLIIRGVNVFPSQIETILLETEGLTPHYQLIVTRSGNLDNMEVRVEVDENVFSDQVKNLQRLESKIEKNIKEFLGVTAKCKLVEPKGIERSEGKAKRIIDMRNA